MRPTHAGWKIYARAQKVETELRYLELDAERVRHDASRKICVGASPLWEIISIPGIVAAFQERFPDVVVSVEIDQKNRLVEQIASGKLDFALCGIDVETSDQDIGHEGNARVDLRVACRKSHPLLQGWSGAVEDIFRANWIDYRFAIQRIRRDIADGDMIEPGSVMETGSWLSGLLTASISDYLVTLPHQLGHFADRFGLAFVPGVPPASSFEAGVWYRKSALSTRGGRAFFNIALESMKSTSDVV